ncbi:hypothetical protein AGLY_016338 [Aphis glycines]|uniref:Uncharacterized protein n=1 Tax=Aphis glycines TaxID=307491 RepID=A0A6G0SYL1_APHGL|nr:hypothetical protein AGLY_016338 [Aphis glycines]
MTEKEEFLRKTSFQPNHCNSKTNHCEYSKFSPNTTEIFDFNENFFSSVNKKILDDQKNLKKCYCSNFYKICRNRKNLQVILKLKNHSGGFGCIFLRNDNHLSSNDFKYLLLFKNSNIDKNLSKSYLYKCFFFVSVSVTSITCRYNALISNLGGGFRWQSEYPSSFQQNGEKQKMLGSQKNLKI